MASSGGDRVAGSETAGRRSGAQQRGGARENGSEQTSSTSKKKQKDKANQESREAKRAAAANAALDGVLAEVKKDVFVDWKQNVNEVTVRLRCGDGVQRIEDINTTFTDTQCNVSFPDGRQWSCQLQEEIEASCSKAQYKEKGGFLHLILHKKIPFHIWPSLKSNKKEKDVARPESRNETKPSTLKSSEKARLALEQLQPRPPSSPAHNEQSRSAGRPERVFKRCFKNKAGDKVAADSVQVKKGSDDRSGASIVPRAAAKGEQPSQEHTLRLPNMSKDAEGEPTSVKSTAADGKIPHPSSHRHEDNREEKEGGSQESGAPGAAAGIRAQVVKTDESSDVSETTIPGTDGQLTAPEIIDRFQNPAKSNKNTDSTPQMPRDGTDLELQGKPTKRESQQDAFISQQPGITETLPEPAAGAAHRQSQSAGLTPKSSTSDGEEKRDQSKEEPTLEMMQQEAPEPMVNLPLVKNDSYEKGTDLMVVNVYMKGICRETARVIFREQDFTLIFQTSDVNFLRLHTGCGPNTVFKWQVKLRNLIQPEQCSYSFTPSRLDITLKKRHSQRWGGLEAPASQGAVGGAKVAVPSSPACMEKSQPGSSQHSLPAKEEPPRVGEEPTKASPRGVEETGLDTVAPRSVSEHVNITKAEPTVTTPQPKPTCMVQPMTHAPPATNECHEEEEEKKVCLPGFTGLVNLGNTCFMNSVIQSLSNTRELRDYFHDRAFESEINCSNPLGTGGRLAIGFAVLLRALWKGTHHAFQPSKLKAIVASKASQFTGYAQHDAQEFMAFLLDGLHEDLNRIQNKPYTETVDSDGRLDEVVAEEAWQRHKMRNDSFIVDLFQGQFKSKLVCPTCSKVSITFDPFLYLPVPLPQKQKVLSVFYFAKEPHKKPIKFLVSVSKENSSTAEVLESISRSVRVKSENLRLAEVAKNRFQRIFLPSHSLDTVSPSDMLFCFEVLSKDLAKERVVLLRVQQKLQVPSIPISKCAACLKPPVSEEDKLKRCTRCYRVGYCNQHCQRTHWPSHKSLCRPNSENVGLPFLVSVPESRLSYARLAQLLEGYSRFSVNVFQPPFQSGRTSPETPQSRLDVPPMALGSPDGAGAGDEAKGAGGDVQVGDADLESPSLPPELQGECSQASAIHSEASGSFSLSSTRTKDSGFSESVSSTSCCSLDPQAEKETTCEKAVRPEAAVTGYQQPSEAASGHASQFYIGLLDSNNKEQRLDEKEDALADVVDDATLELVWKNNERLKEYVLVSSKELEYEDDPSSMSETARAGHFTLEQCLNLFTKPEVLAPEEAWAQNVLSICLLCVATGWRLFDDSTVTMVEESQVVTRYAYVLFYRRRNSPVERPPRFLSPGAESATATGASASQASLIWRELEEEDEGPDEGPRGLFRSPLRSRQVERNRGEEEAGARRRRRHKMSDYPDEDCVRYLVVATLTAVIALFVNLVYPFLYKIR
ncbi:ubiquitin carboxyl-terminal hydrolase 19 [Poecilia latipinna]|uniref:ubiquitin carboxyl-terminal hydrolase 19 n=1 Tax=Poecilia latipinna TaxID=48699 RepID=UPI00072ED3E5|nr:PREDICTED: ubiquitin carboxyl-terminal hydrolase 19 [Poecilia latipinna]